MQRENSKMRQLPQERYRELREVIDPSSIAPMEGREEVVLVNDTVQRNGSFKVRGATHMMQQAVRLGLLRESDVVYCASAGNHGQGVALGAAALGLEARVYLPESVPDCKVEAIRDFGAKDVLVDGRVDDALVAAQEEARSSGGFFVHPFDDITVIEGQASLGYEIASSPFDLDRVFVPVGGGGLLAGVCMALSEMGSKAKVIGVQLEGCDAFATSVEQGRLVELAEVNDLADGTAVRRAGALALEMVTSSPNFGGIMRVGNRQLGEAVVELEGSGVYAETAAGLSLAGVNKFERIYGGGGVNAAVVTGRHRDTNRLEQLLAA